MLSDLYDRLGLTVDVSFERVDYISRELSGAATTPSGQNPAHAEFQMQSHDIVCNTSGNFNKNNITAGAASNGWTKSSLSSSYLKSSLSTPVRRQPRESSVTFSRIDASLSVQTDSPEIPSSSTGIDLQASDEKVVQRAALQLHMLPAAHSNAATLPRRVTKLDMPDFVQASATPHGRARFDSFRSVKKARDLNTTPKIESSIASLRLFREVSDSPATVTTPDCGEDTYPPGFGMPTEVATRGKSQCCSSTVRRRKSKNVAIGVTKLCVCLVCCCGTPIIALVILFNVSEVECNDYFTSKCWEDFTVAVVGSFKPQCKSTKTCSELNAIEETHWVFMDAFSQASCIEQQPDASDSIELTNVPENVPSIVLKDDWNSSWEYSAQSGSYIDGYETWGPHSNSTSPIRGSDLPLCNPSIHSGLTTLEMAEQQCSERGARLCTVMELVEVYQTCRRIEDGIITSPIFWSRTQSECEAEADNYWIVGNSFSSEDPMQPQVVCAERTLAAAVTKCCADTEVIDCKPDWYNWTVDAAGSWSNYTQAVEDDDFEFHVGKAVTSSVGIAVWCLCSLWMCFLSCDWIKNSAKRCRSRRQRKRDERDETLMKNLSRSVAMSGDIDQQKRQLLSRTQSGKEACRLQGLSMTPRSEGVKDRAAELWPTGYSLSDVPDSIKVRVLAYAGDCRTLARLSTICKWWNNLKFQAARHLSLSAQQWKVHANQSAFSHAISRYSRLISVDVTTAAPAVGSPTAPWVVDGNAVLDTLLKAGTLRGISIKASTNGTGPYDFRTHGPLWRLTPEFGRKLARSRSLKTLDFTSSVLEHFAAWPLNLEVLCLRGCSYMQVFPGEPRSIRKLGSLDLSVCTQLYDLSALFGCSSLRWLNLAQCSALSNLAPIAGCIRLETLILNRCTNLSQVSAIGTLSALRVLDLSACHAVEDLAVLGRAWGKQANRLTKRRDRRLAYMREKLETLQIEELRRKAKAYEADRTLNRTMDSEDERKVLVDQIVSKEYASAKRVSLSKCDISWTALEDAAVFQHCHHLESLDIRNCRKLQRDSISKLQECLPHVHLQSD
eukprot:SAG31_NODE_1415_length_8443_cov_6.910986_3_plen_1063_part_00